MTGLRIACIVRNWAVLAEMGPIWRGVGGAKTVQVNNVMRVLVTLLQNKRGMSAFCTREQACQGSDMYRAMLQNIQPRKSDSNETGNQSKNP